MRCVKILRCRKLDLYLTSCFCINRNVLTNLANFRSVTNKILLFLITHMLLLPMWQKTTLHYSHQGKLTRNYPSSNKKQMRRLNMKWTTTKCLNSSSNSINAITMLISLKWRSLPMSKQFFQRQIKKTGVFLDVIC